MIRGQSNVVGVALLLGIAVVSMGALTATVGVLIDSTAAEADAERVTSDLSATLEPVASTGQQRGTVSFSEGRLTPAERRLEIRANGAVLETVRVDALVFESSDSRVVFEAGAIIRGSGQGAWMEQSPPITLSEEVLIVGAPRLGEDVSSIGGTGGVNVAIRTDVSHDRHELGDEEFTIALETTTPGAWERHFDGLGADVGREDGTVPIVTATFEGERTGYLVVHDLDAEVGNHG